MQTTQLLGSYLAAYRDAQAQIKAIQAMIHDLPAPEGETTITWEHVGKMEFFASDLKMVFAKQPKV